MKKLELIKPSSYLIYSLLAMLLMTMSPTIGWASSVSIQVLDGGYGTGLEPFCSIGCFYQDGEYDPEAVRSATIFVGEGAYWNHLAGAPHDVTASTTQGDYRGHTCPEPGGLSAYLPEHDYDYNHQFVTVGDCYYRSTLDPPSTGYPGLQGVIHVMPSTGPSPVWVMPFNISTLPSAPQTFTAIYTDPGGWGALNDTSLTLSGGAHSEVLHYNPVTNKFTLVGVGGDCSPGQATTLSNAYLTLDCSTSTALGSDVFLTVGYHVTPQPPISGAAYRMVAGVVEMGGANRSRDFGYWVVDRRPNIDSVTPMNSTTPTGTQQTFVAVYSDPDGYQNIAESNFYLAGGLTNQWLHYIQAANIFVMMNAPGVCVPGQAATLSNGSLSLNCATSTVVGLGNNQTITFRVTPLAGSSGINYNIFPGVSDQAGQALGAFGGSWGIP